MSDQASGLPAGRERDQWLAINLRHMAALATVARESSFTDAADRLGYGQSAVSQQIAYLERIVGRRLVERSGRPRSVALTEAGVVMLEHIEAILGQLRLAKEELDDVARRSPEPPSFGMASIFGTWLPAALLPVVLAHQAGSGWGRFARGPSHRLVEAVTDGQLDAAFVELPTASGPLLALELLREPCVLAVPADAAPRPRGVDAALRRWSLVAVEDCRATLTLQAQVAAAGRPARVEHSVESPASALPFVRAGVAVAVVTRRDVPQGDASLITLPLPSVADRVLGLTWHRARDGCPAIAALGEWARTAFPPGGLLARD